MTKEEILAMKPGVELNKAIAERIMGHVVKNDEILGYVERTVNPKSQMGGASCTTPVKGDSVWGSLEHYSEDIAAARTVIDKMIEAGYQDAQSWPDFGGGKYTEAEAVCKAALIAVL